MTNDYEFRERATAFLERHAAPRDSAHQVWGQGSDQLKVFQEKTPDQAEEELAAAKAWQRMLFDAGLGWICGPSRFGGAELPPHFEKTFRELQQEFELPSLAPLGMGLGIVGPTLLADGSDAARETYVRGIFTGEIVACQLFSEPEAGSDLAGVRTRAEETAGGWRVNGQKVWTSGAHQADIGLLLCRTEADTPGRAGLSVLLVDMHAAGVEVRPLRMMTGGASFNEVFLTDVPVPAANLVGDRGAGWAVVRATLAQERASMGSGGTDYGLGIDTGRLLELMERCGCADEPVVRQEYARVLISSVLAEVTTSRLADTPQLPLVKLLTARTFDATSAFVTEVLGTALVADTGDWGTYAWSHAVLAAPGLHIAGGTDEILKNILAETVLGLPR